MDRTEHSATEQSPQPLTCLILMPNTVLNSYKISDTVYSITGTRDKRRDSYVVEYGSCIQNTRIFVSIKIC